MLLVHHRHAALPILRRIPGAGGRIGRWIGFATADTEEDGSQGEKQKELARTDFHFMKRDEPV